MGGPCNCLLPNGLLRRKSGISGPRREAGDPWKKRKNRPVVLGRSSKLKSFNYSAITSNSTSVAFPFPKSIWAL
jgi:hypothetical protein